MDSSFFYETITAILTKPCFLLLILLNNKLFALIKQMIVETLSPVICFFWMERPRFLQTSKIDVKLTKSNTSNKTKFTLLFYLLACILTVFSCCYVTWERHMVQRDTRGICGRWPHRAWICAVSPFINLLWLICTCVITSEHRKNKRWLWRWKVLRLSGW